MKQLGDPPSIIWLAGILQASSTATGPGRRYLGVDDVLQFAFSRRALD